jgi:hypothetical protein
LQRDGLINSAQFVIVIGPFADDFQAQVDFREGGNANFGHVYVMVSQVLAKPFAQRGAGTG